MAGRGPAKEMEALAAEQKELQKNQQIAADPSSAPKPKMSIEPDVFTKSVDQMTTAWDEFENSRSASTLRRPSSSSSRRRRWA